MKRVLMPTDGSACSEAAIREGLEIVRALGGEVTFLYALEHPAVIVDAAPSMAAYVPQLYEDLKDNAQEALAHAQSLADEAHVPAHTRLVEHQRPADAIHEAEQTHDLVVMGTHGRRGFNRVILGSVAEEALHRASKPYLMFRHSPGERVKAEQPTAQPGLL